MSKLKGTLWFPFLVLSLSNKKCRRHISVIENSAIEIFGNISWSFVMTKDSAIEIFYSFVATSIGLDCPNAASIEICNSFSHTS